MEALNETDILIKESDVTDFYTFCQCVTAYEYEDKWGQYGYTIHDFNDGRSEIVDEWDVASELEAMNKRDAKGMN